LKGEIKIDNLFSNLCALIKRNDIYPDAFIVDIVEHYKSLQFSAQSILDDYQQIINSAGKEYEKYQISYPFLIIKNIGFT